MTNRVHQLALVFASFLSLMAIAQPGTSTPLGDVGMGDVRIATASLPSHGTVWFQFRLTTGITPLANWLDIDTARSMNVNGTSLDTTVALYDQWGNRLALDDDGGGDISATTVGASGLSYGGGSGERLGGTAPDWFGGRISDGWNGTTYATLRPGIYYLAVAEYGIVFPNFADPNPLFASASNTGPSTGTIRVRVAAGAVPGDTWNEVYRGQDGGDHLTTAQVVAGQGLLSRILCQAAVDGRDMFKITICDPANFSVTATATTDWGWSFQSRLFLFDEAGHGIAAINETGLNPTVLTLPTSVPPGNYYIAWNNYCASQFGYPGPLDGQGRAMWTFPPHDQSIAPNGPGMTGTLDRWGRLGPCNGVARYDVRLDFTGACYVDQSGGPGCEPDFNRDGNVDQEDVAAMINVVAGGDCP